MVLRDIMFLPALIGRLGDSAVRATLAAKFFRALLQLVGCDGAVLPPGDRCGELSSMIGSAGGAAADSVGGGGGSAQSGRNCRKTSFSRARGARRGTSAVSLAAVGGRGDRGWFFWRFRGRGGRCRRFRFSGFFGLVLGQFFRFRGLLRRRVFSWLHCFKTFKFDWLDRSSSGATSCNAGPRYDAQTRKVLGFG